MQQSVTECDRVFQSISEYYKVIESVAEYYEVFLAHLLGPIFGLIIVGTISIGGPYQAQNA